MSFIGMKRQCLYCQSKQGLTVILEIYGIRGFVGGNNAFFRKDQNKATKVVMLQMFAGSCLVGRLVFFHEMIKWRAERSRTLTLPVGGQVWIQEVRA